MTVLSVDPDSRATPDNDAPGEFYCPDCHARCTRGHTGTEYGHVATRDGDRERCPRRPAACDSTRNRGGQLTEGRNEFGRFVPTDADTSDAEEDGA